MFLSSRIHHTRNATKKDMRFFWFLAPKFNFNWENPGKKVGCDGLVIAVWMVSWGGGFGIV
jgi:hypothetical protein